jgi:hypothetical protein
MRQVTKEEFFKAVGPLNCHPRPGRRETLWEMLDGTRRVVGRSTPGYMCEGPTAWFLAGVAP